MFKNELIFLCLCRRISHRYKTIAKLFNHIAHGFIYKAHGFNHGNKIKSRTKYRFQPIKILIIKIYASICRLLKIISQNQTSNTLCNNTYHTYPVTVYPILCNTRTYSCTWCICFVCVSKVNL